MMWNDEYQATGVFGTSMGYFGPDQMFRVNAGSTNFAYNQLGTSQKTTGTTTSNYTRDPAGNLLNERIGSSTYNYLYDGVGNVVGLTDGNGDRVDQYSYDPYGKQTVVSATVDNPWGYHAGYNSGTPNVIKFGDRYYDPTTGRWTSADPIDRQGVRGTNRYLYAGDDPVNNADPTGLIGLDVTLDVGIGVHIGVTCCSHGLHGQVGGQIGFGVKAGVTPGEPDRSGLTESTFGCAFRCEQYSVHPLHRGSTPKRTESYSYGFGGGAGVDIGF